MAAIQLCKNLKDYVLYGVNTRAEDLVKGLFYYMDVR